MSRPYRSALLRSVEGLSRLGFLIIILILASCVYVGYHVFPFYYYYWELEGLMQAQADKASEFTDAEIRENLMAIVKEHEIPLDEPDEDLKINRFDGKIVIDMKYQEVLYIDLGEKTYDLHVFNFNPHVEQSLKGRGR